MPGRRRSIRVYHGIDPWTVIECGIFFVAGAHCRGLFRHCRTALGGGCAARPTRPGLRGPASSPTPLHVFLGPLLVCAEGMILQSEDREAVPLFRPW